MILTRFSSKRDAVRTTAKLACGTLAVTLASPATAQFLLLKDVNIGGTDSAPTNLVEFGTQLFFAADDGVNGRELWISNGMPENTDLLLDINPGPDSSNPDELTVVSFRSMYFSADDGTNGVELWETDGSDIGTLLATDINPGAASSNPHNLTAGGPGTLFFAADDGSTGVELWKRSSLGGTEQLADLMPGPGSSNPHNLFYHNGILYFAADDGSNGVELYKYDGVSVTQLMDINMGAASSDPGEFEAIGSNVYFAATQAATGRELYMTDGTSATLIKDINPGAVSSNPHQLTSYSGYLVFAAEMGTTGIELWRSDGTVAGTVMVEDLLPGNGKSSDPMHLTAYNGLVVFGAAKATPNSRELWAYNGTNIFELKKIENGNIGSDPDQFTIVNGVLVFVADDHKFFGREIWRTEGTPETTFMVQDINPGSADANPDHLVVIQNQLFFTAIDANGDEPWHQGDGTVLAVVLSELYAENGSIGANPVIRWSTAAELGNVGFHLYRLGENGGRGERLTSSLIPAQGNEAQGAEYSFTDPLPSSGDDRAYILVDIDMEGVETEHPLALYGASYNALNTSVSNWEVFEN